MATGSLVPDPATIRPKTPKSQPLAPDPATIAPRYPMSPAMVNLRQPGAGKEPALQAMLERSGQLLPALLQRGPGAAGQALLHGVQPQQYESDVRKTAGLPATGRGTELFLNEMALDPATYFGMGKGGEKLVEGVTTHALPAVMKGAASIASRSSLAAKPFVDWLAGMGGEAHDFMTPGGKPVAHAIRELARREGAEGIRKAERMQSAATGSRAMGQTFTAVLQDLKNKALRGLDSGQEGEVYKAIHYDKIGSLPPQLRSAAQRLQAVDRAIPYVMGTKKLRDQLTQAGYKLPRELQLFDTGPRGIVGTKNYLASHVPMPHELSPDEAELAMKNLRSGGGKRALHDIRNQFFKARSKNFDARIFNDPDLIREVWNRSFAAAGRQMTGAHMRTALQGIFGTGIDRTRAVNDMLAERLRGAKYVPKEQVIGMQRLGKTTSTTELKHRIPDYVRAAYAAQAPKEMSFAQQGLKALEQAGNIGKSTLFVTPFPHQKNISTLLALANPSTFPRAALTYAKMGAGFASTATKARVLADSLKAGAAGLPNIEQTGLTNLLEKGGPFGKAFAGIYKASGKALWAWDDAARDALYHSELKKFKGDSLRAAAAVRKKLVDYSQSSQAQELIRMFAPFAVWRTAMPTAVVRSIAEHPEYAIALDRLTHGAIAGAQFNIDGKPYQSSNPLAEAGELIPPETPKYLRSALSFSGKAGTNLLFKAVGAKEQPFSKEYLESQIPLVGQAMQFSGHSPYGDTPAQSLLQLLTGIHPVTHPRRKRTPPRPRMY